METGTAYFLLKPFEALNPFELYAIIRLRNEVFVVEQNCVFQDADNKDQACLHLMYWNNNKLIAYCRLVPPTVAYDEMSIGRVVSSPYHRKSGAGRQLIGEAIQRIPPSLRCSNADEEPRGVVHGTVASNARPSDAADADGGSAG